MSVNVNSKTTVKKEDKTNITIYNSRLSQNLHINNIYLLDNNGLGRGCLQKMLPPHSQIIFLSTLYFTNHVAETVCDLAKALHCVNYQIF
jgi:hypothetical protein